MTGIVVDASISASWLLPDETDDFAFQIYRRFSSLDVYVPSLWNYEIRNILIVSERRGRITAAAADAAFEFLSNLNLLVDHETDWTETVALSRRFKLTVYDAAYLELALRLDLPLATLDKALIGAAVQLDRRAGPSTP